MNRAWYWTKGRSHYSLILWWHSWRWHHAASVVGAGIQSNYWHFGPLTYGKAVWPE